MNRTQLGCGTRFFLGGEGLGLEIKRSMDGSMDGPLSTPAKCHPGTQADTCHPAGQEVTAGLLHGANASGEAAALAVFTLGMGGRRNRGREESNAACETTPSLPCMCTLRQWKCQIWRGRDAARFCGMHVIRQRLEYNGRRWKNCKSTNAPLFPARGSLT